MRKPVDEWIIYGWIISLTGVKSRRFIAKPTQKVHGQTKTQALQNAGSDNQTNYQRNY